MLTGMFKKGAYLMFSGRLSKSLLLLLAGGVTYPQLQAKFDLYYNQDDPKNKEIIDKCPHIKWGYFFPTFYLGHGLLQAWFGSISRTFDENVDYKEEMVTLPCGSKIALRKKELFSTYVAILDWAKHKTPVNSLAAEPKKQKLLVILPGMTASSQEPYVINLVSEALLNRYEVVVYHPRGVKAELTLPKEGYVDPAEDFKHAVNEIRAGFPNAQMFAVGHSYGANTLMNYLGKYRDCHPFMAAASVANPFDFLKAGKFIQNTYSDSYLTRSVIKLIKSQGDSWKNAPQHIKIDIEKALSAQSIIDFDQYLTSKYMGYESNLDYYKGVSSKKHIGNVNIPLLCMNSRDDPILHIPIEECKMNRNIFLLITNNGGHVGWFQGVFQPTRWFPKPVIEFLNATIE